jgi:Zn-dependent alcohol dehydrogenase
MKTNAAVLRDRNQKWEVEAAELDGPKQAEVMVRPHPVLTTTSTSDR